MVSRGRRSLNRYQYEEEKKDEEEEEEVEPRSTAAAEGARIREAQYLAQEALRMAIEARQAVIRLKEYRARITLPYRRGNTIDVDDTSTLREDSVSSRCL